MKWITSAMLAATAWMALLAVPHPAMAQDYKIGPEDVLHVSVWRHPELERSVTVNADGEIVFSPIGSIKAAGLTAAELGERLGNRLTSYMRETVTATVTVTDFVSHSVFVSGSVSKPGRYGFERIPGLLDAINYAGGATTDADLRRVQILRREGTSRRLIPVDLAAALQQGTEAGLPELQASDIILVPSATAIGGAATQDAVGVMGEVLKPGLYPVGTGLDLWWVIAQAGGPTTNANMSSIKVLRKEAEARNATTIDLKRVLDRGSDRPIVIRPGDIVFINPKGVSLWGGFLNLLAVTRDVASIIAIIDVLQRP